VTVRRAGAETSLALVLADRIGMSAAGSGAPARSSR